MKALILDFGGPVLLTPFELVESGTAAYQLLHGRGPMATPEHPDPDWAELQAGRISERTYWDHRAVEWHDLVTADGPVDHEPTVQSMIAHLYEPARPELVRPGALALIHEAKLAGHPVGVLTNDLRAFHTDAWVAQMRVLDEVDVIVDGSTEGYLKPHPRLYELMSERLGVEFADMVFVDDQMTNIRGAEALGIPSVLFAPQDPAAAYAEARGLLGS